MAFTALATIPIATFRATLPVNTKLKFDPRQQTLKLGHFVQYLGHELYSCSREEIRMAKMGRAHQLR
jgi:hypothetical protein